MTLGISFLKKSYGHNINPYRIDEFCFVISINRQKICKYLTVRNKQIIKTKVFIDVDIQSDLRDIKFTVRYKLIDLM